jgi:hypothetical protein
VWQLRGVGFFGLNMRDQGTAVDRAIDGFVLIGEVERALDHVRR